MNRPRGPLAEDHPETAARLRAVLSADFDVVAWVEDGAALVAAARQYSPDAIVADINLPNVDGLSATACIHREDASSRIVLVCVDEESMLVDAALAAGALGYVLTNTAGDDLVAAVRAVTRRSAVRQPRASLPNGEQAARQPPHRSAPGVTHAPDT